MAEARGGKEQAGLRPLAEPALDFQQGWQGLASHAPAPSPPAQHALPTQSGGSLCPENMLEDSEMFPESQVLGARGGLCTPLPHPPSPGLTDLPSVPQTRQVRPNPGPLSGP